MEFIELYKNLSTRMQSHDIGEIAKKSKITVTFAKMIRKGKFDASIKTLQKISDAIDSMECEKNE